MRQFDVFTNPSRESRDFAPYVVALQSHHVALDSVVVAPILTDAEGAFDLPVEFGGQILHAAMAELANVPSRNLGRAKTSLLAHEDDIRCALDRLFTGF